MAIAKDTKANNDGASAVAKGEAKPGAEVDDAVPANGRFAFLDLNAVKPLHAAVAALVLALFASFFLFAGGEQAATRIALDGGYGPAARPVFYDVPDILVNVATDGDKPAFLKLSVSLELEGTDPQARAAIEPVLPRVVDQLQTYLRELRIEDLTGSAAVFRLKEEMLRRVNLAVEPVRVKDVLFREMIIQ